MLVEPSGRLPNTQVVKYQARIQYAVVSARGNPVGERIGLQAEADRLHRGPCQPMPQITQRRAPSILREVAAHLCPGLGASIVGEFSQIFADIRVERNTVEVSVQERLHEIAEDRKSTRLNSSH